MAFKLGFYNSKNGKFKGYVDDEVYKTEAEAEEARVQAEVDFAAGAAIMEQLGEKPSKNIIIDVTII